MKSVCVSYCPVKETVMNTQGQKEGVAAQTRHVRISQVLWVAVFTLAVIGVMLYSSFTGGIIAERYAPLVDAAMEIKLEASIGHLCFMELETEESDVDIDDVWRHLDQAEWYARAMLEGGENPEGKYVPLKDADLRREIEQALEGINTFRAIARKRWEAISQPDIELEIDPRFHKIFKDFLASADKVKIALQQVMRRQLLRFHILQALLVVIIVALGAVMSIALRCCERRRTSDMLALQDKEENLRTTLHSIGDAVIATDTKGNITRMNPVAVSLTGWEAEDAQGRPLTEVFHIINTLTKELAVNPVQRVLDSGNIVGLANHTALIAKDGTEHQIADSAAPIRNTEGTIIGVVLVFRDVTEEYAMLAERERERNFMQTVINGLPEALMVINRDYTISLANKTIRDATGGKDPVAACMKCYNVTHDRESPCDCEEHPCPLKQVLETKLPVMLEHIHQDSQGREINVEVTAAPIFDENGEVAQIIESSRDITKRKLIEKEREQFVKTLEFKNKEMKDIVYTASHDLRSPLVNIQGFSGELEKDCAHLLKLLDKISIDPEQKKQIELLSEKNIPQSLGFIVGSTNKMASLLDGLLQVSRIGTAKVDCEPIDTNKIVSQVLAAMEYQIKQNDVAVSAETLPDCIGDVNMLDQVFTNLIGNAIKYRETSRKSEIHISAKVKDNMSVYCVADNGIGISPKHQSKVFEIFHRLNPNDAAGGEGLGLTIVVRILDRLGGRIWVESEPGEGSKFFFELPTA